MKLYQKEFILLGWQKEFSDKYDINTTVEWAKNLELVNHSDFSVFDSDKRAYTPNAPVNAAVGGEAHFPEHNSLIWNTQLTARPWVKYTIRNGRKNEIENSSPTFSLQDRFGIPDALDSDIDFHHAEVRMQHTFDFPAGGILNFNIGGGAFLGNGKAYFPQWKHFAGNRTPFATQDPAKSFRMLDYYLLSTDQEYVTLFTNYQFRKLLATQIFEVRLLGIRESIFLNALEAPSSDHYFELGYGLNYIFRIFRLEFVTAWQDFKYQDFSVRIGIAANLNNLFN
jgi:hypothetical protein